MKNCPADCKRNFSGRAEGPESAAHAAPGAAPGARLPRPTRGLPAPVSLAPLGRMH